jgi:hypothetical protein
MQAATAEMMLRTFNKLSREQLDDVESQYENLQVLFERIRDNAQEHSHVPAIELHVGELTETMYTQLGMLLQSPFTDDEVSAMLRHLVWDYLKGAIMFGYEIGRVGWPVKEYSCKEAHTDDE